MSRFRQAPPDPEKAARDFVANYVPSRHQPNVSHKCEVCPRTAKWLIKADGDNFFACDNHRKEYAISAINYQEERIR